MRAYQKAQQAQQGANANDDGVVDAEFDEQ